MSKILIIGKIPPPIGGVTIHVSRLLDALSEAGVSYKFIPLTTFSVPKILFSLPFYKAFHLHTNSVKFQILIVWWGNLFRRKSIVTIHGDLAGLNNQVFSNRLKLLKMASIPIVLNQKSFLIAKERNRNVQLVSSFIFPRKQTAINDRLRAIVSCFRSRYKFIYATNAYGMSFDGSNQEIYGIIDLISVFKDKPEYGLIISDPSSQYKQYIDQSQLYLTNNILLISEEHSYFEILKCVDASIRNTSTDGDSLSVKESLVLKKLTFATDIVSRPSGIITYKRGDYTVFFSAIENGYANTEIDGEIDGAKKLIQLYEREVGKGDMEKII